MKIIRFEFHDEIWGFSTVQLKKLNLFVGASGSGKTKFLQSIFSIANFIHNNVESRAGNWFISMTINGVAYEYEWSAVAGAQGLPTVTKEKLDKVMSSKRISIFVRDIEKFTFGEKELPKLSPVTSGIYLLKEEKEIKPVFDGFGSIYRRSFSGADLAQATSEVVIAKKTLDALKKADTQSLGLDGSVVGNEKNVNIGHPGAFYNLPLGLRLMVLKRTKPLLYKKISDSFCSVFPHVHELIVKAEKSQATILGDGYSPNVWVREKGVGSPIALADLSSGMQKVLLLMVDMFTLPDKTIYMIDEYENSLGINAINFLPEFLDDHGGDRQFILTTHHPYLINKVPISNWLVFSRKGSKVTIRQGDELKAKYSSSAQEAFTQLINDPAYFEHA